MALDTSDNVYVGGWTYAALLGNSSQGSIDAFVVKFDTGGVIQ